MKKTGLISRVLLFIFVSVFITACPVFKSVKYPKTVFLGDTITIEVSADMLGRRYNPGSEIGIELPPGWKMADTSLWIQGIENPEKLLSLESYYENSQTWKCWVRDSILSDTVSWKFSIYNSNQIASVDTLIIFMWDGWDNWWHERQNIIIHSTNNPLIPTQLELSGDDLRWKAPKVKNGLIGYKVHTYDNSYSTMNTMFEVNHKKGINTFSVSAMYQGDLEKQLQDTLLVFKGDTVFVSENGDPDGRGTRLDPITDIQTGIDFFRDEIRLEKKKTLLLMQGTYTNPVQGLIPDQLSIKGEGPMNTRIKFTDTENGLSTRQLYRGVNISDLSIYSDNATPISLNTGFWTGPSDGVFNCRLQNVWITNTGNANIGIYSSNTRVIFDHILVDGMDSVGVLGSPYVDSIINSVFVNNKTALNMYYLPGSIVNSIFHANDTDLLGYYANDTIGYRISHSIISREWVDYGPGNLNVDPLFLEDENYPYLLDPMSPAVDAGIDSMKYNDTEDPLKPGFALFPARGSTRGDIGLWNGVKGEQTLSTSNRSNRQKFTVYPNPVTDMLYVDSGIPGTSSVKIYDTMGRIVLEESTFNSLDVGGLKVGMYFISIQAGEVKQTATFIKR